jgi:hypothetical protein
MWVIGRKSFLGAFWGYLGYVLHCIHVAYFCYAFGDVVFLFIAVFKIAELLYSAEKVMYNKTIMSSAEQILALIIATASVVTSVGYGVRWLTKHYFEEIKHEMKPNNGSSIKDQVSRLEEKTDKLESKIDNLYNILVTEGVKTQKKTKSEKSEL